MTEQKTNVITIDGKEYKEEDLSQDQSYFINQIRDLQVKAASLKFQLDQINMLPYTYFITIATTKATIPSVPTIDIASIRHILLSKVQSLSLTI